jgi:hypothetical protein
MNACHVFHDIVIFDNDTIKRGQMVKSRTDWIYKKFRHVLTSKGIGLVLMSSTGLLETGFSSRRRRIHAYMLYN